MFTTLLPQLAVEGRWGLRHLSQKHLTGVVTDLHGALPRGWAGGLDAGALETWREEQHHVGQPGVPMVSLP